MGRDSKEKKAKKREEKALKSRNEKNRKAAKKALKERNAKERNAKEANKKEGANKEKNAKAAAHEKNTKLAKERKGKNTCVLKAYEHNNYRGKVLSTHHVCSSEHSFHLPKTGRRRGYQASSFKLSSGCRQVQLWDEDACRKNYRDNVNIQSSVSSVKYDLNDDICGVTVWANRNGWCRL